MFADDPVYSQIMAYLANGGTVYTNPNAAAMDTLCKVLAGTPAASLPSGQTQLLALYNQMQDRLSNATTYFNDAQEWSPVLLPTNPDYTVQGIEDAFMQCILPDFAPILAGWIQRAQSLDSTQAALPQLLADILTFVNNQQTSFTNFQNLYTQAQATLAAMSAFVSGSSNQNSIMSQGLQQLVSAMQMISAAFGTIGPSPGQKYKEWAAIAGPLGAGNGVNTSLPTTPDPATAGAASGTSSS